MIARAFIIGFMVGFFNGILIWVRERYEQQFQPRPC